MKKSELSFDHILNLAHKKAAFDIGEKRCHSGNTQKFQNYCLCQW